MNSPQVSRPGQFTAAQAAQKSTRARGTNANSFTAAQAAQKLASARMAC